jgi:hypothetical protein
MVEEDGEVAKAIVGRIVHIFLTFSQAESHVKDLVADRMILKRKSTRTTSIIGTYPTDLVLIISTPLTLRVYREHN